MPILKNTNFIVVCWCLIFHIPNKWTAVDGPGINYQSAIRKGDWKMVYDMRDRSKQLYNLQSDIGENNDVAAQNPEVVKALSTALGTQLRQWKATMPIDKKSNTTAPMPDEN